MADNQTSPLCAVATCGRERKTREWCATHYARWRKYGDVDAARPVVTDVMPTRCSIDGCPRRPQSRGWCTTHYERWRLHGDPLHETWTHACKIDGCDKPHLARGWCSKHWTRWQRFGDPLADVGFRGEYPTAALCATGCGRPRAKREMCARCYRREHMRDNGAATSARRRARERSAICIHGAACIDGALITSLRAESCLYCGAPAKHADHFEPLARGGLHCRENLVPACAACNISKNDNEPWSWWASRSVAVA